MAAMRAKMRVNSVVHHEDKDHVRDVLKFSAVTSRPFSSEGLDEDNTFAKWTPHAELVMTILNPALIGKFVEGQVFYVDFTEAEAS
jgi:hypothetical protein